MKASTLCEAKPQAMTTRIHLSIMQPAGYVHSQGFLDQARYARYQFRRLGAEVTIGKNRLREDSVNIIFGAHLGFDADLKQRHTCVFFNLEQLGEGGARVSQNYMNLLSSSAVIDYDERNLAAYGCQPGDVPVVSFQYAPYLATAPALPLQDRPIDLLFFGSINERRKDIFSRIEACGWSVSMFDHPLYGEERDQFIRQAKAVFNCHFYESSRFEQARAFHTLSLGTPVVSERTARTTPPPAFEDAVSWVTDENLERFFRDEFMTPAWRRRAEVHLQNFTNADPFKQWQVVFNFSQSLQASESTAKAVYVWRPKAIHLGSGSRYQPGWLNINKNERTQPDLVLNLEQQLKFPITGKTPGGRQILIEEETIDSVYITSSVERDTDIQTLSVNLLNLLKEDGELIADFPLRGSPFERSSNPDAGDYFARNYFHHGTLSHRFELSSTKRVDAWLNTNTEEQDSLIRLVLRKRGTTPKERTLFRCQHETFGDLGDDACGSLAVGSVEESNRASPLEANDLLALELVEDSDHIDQLIKAGQFDKALAHIAGCVNATFLKPGVVHHALYYPRLDAHLSRMADILANKRSPIQARTLNENHLIIATELYRIGGHSKVVKEVARELPNAVLLLTDLFGNRFRNPADFKWIEDEYDTTQIVDLTKGTLWERAQELASHVQQLQPASIWYFNHHQDPIPFVGTLGIKGPQKVLLHHCDHNPSLGATLPDLLHVDITDTLQQACSRRLNKRTELLRLHVFDQGVKEPMSISGTDYSVVTAGRPGKFARSGALSLSQIVVTTLSTVQGRHYHIGPLDVEWQHDIVEKLLRKGLNPERFVYLGAVTSLWETLLRIDAAAYIGSAPVSGGRGAVEAQGCGLPVLPFTGFEAGSLLADFSSYANIDLGWADISSLATQLQKLGNRQRELSQRARAFYESQFSRDEFCRQVKQLSTPQDPHDVEAYTTNSLVEPSVLSNEF